MPAELSDLQKRLQAIEARNKRVEADKAWETSWLRRAIVALMTYCIVVSFMLVAHIDKPLLNALVPCGAYLFSTWSLPFVKKIWIEKYTK